MAEKVSHLLARHRVLRLMIRVGYASDHIRTMFSGIITVCTLPQLRGIINLYDRRLAGRPETSRGPEMMSWRLDRVSDVEAQSTHGSLM